MNREAWIVVMLLFSGFILGVLGARSMSTKTPCPVCSELAQNAPRTIFVDTPCPTYGRPPAIAPEPILGQYGASYSTSDPYTERRQAKRDMEDALLESEARMKLQMDMDRRLNERQD
jgi:hypothetical protein